MLYKKRGEEFQVSTQGGNPSVVLLSNSNFIVAWDSSTSDGNTDVYGQVFSYNNTKLGAEFLVNTRTQSLQAFPDVSSFPDGGFVITWVSLTGSFSHETDIYAQMFRNDGAKQGPEFLVNTYTASSQSGPSVENLGSQGFVIVWYGLGYSSSQLAVSGQIFNRDGSKRGTEFKINTQSSQNQFDPFVSVLSNNNFIVIWSGQIGDQGNYQYGVYGQIFNNDGIRQGSEFEVEPAAFNMLNYDKRISVSSFINAGFGVVWENSSLADTKHSSYGQIFRNDGTKQGSTFLVASTVNSQNSPSITTLSGNNFIVTWSNGTSRGIDKYEIYGQLFNIDGTRQGQDFIVNTYTIGYQLYAISQRLNENEFIVTWSSLDQYTLVSSIHGQVFSKDDKKSYTYKVTPYEMAALSVEVYNNEDDNGYLPSGRLLAGWRVVTDPPNNLIEDGFFSRVYSKDSEGIVVMAFAGTDSPADIVGDDAAMALGNPPEQLSNALRFYNYFQTTYNVTESDYHQFRLFFTGHSLGAALAELAAAIFRLPVISFESPGVRTIINNLISDPQGSPDFASYFSTNGLEYVDSVSVSYLTAPNLVNTMAPHVGRFFRVYPPFTGQSVADGFLDYLGDAEDYIAGFITRFTVKGQHKMVPIIQQFDSITGNPKIYSAVINDQWPAGISVDLLNLRYDGYDHFMCIDLNTFFWEKALQYRWQTNDDFVRFFYQSFDDYRETFIRRELSSKLITSFIPRGVTITGDDNENVFFGSTNLDDDFNGGNEADTYYLFGGVDTVIDRGGFDQYVFLTQNFLRKYEPSQSYLTKSGRKIESFYSQAVIDDADGNGIIKIGDAQLTGLAYRIAGSSNYLLLLKDNKGKPVAAFMLTLIQSGEGTTDLLITSSNSVYRSTITVKNYQSGQYDIQLTENQQSIPAILLGTEGKDILDCTQVVERSCMAVSFGGDRDNFITDINQDATLISHPNGNKIYTFVESTTEARRLQSTNSSSNNTGNNNYVKIYGVKVGDQLDLSHLSTETLQNLNITNLPNSTGSIFSFANGVALTIDFSSDSTPFSFLTFANGTMITSPMYENVTSFNITADHISSPSFTPTVSSTNIPSATSSASTTYTDLATLSKSSTSTTTPSVNPSPSSSPFSVQEITEGGSYSGTLSRDNFVINANTNTIITGNGGVDRFTVKPNSNVNITITDFDITTEQIDLSAFSNIHGISDFAITQGSAIINLPENQKIILQNLQPSDVSSNNFIFSPQTIDPSGDKGLNLPAIIGGVLGGVVGLALVGIIGYGIWKTCNKVSVVPIVTVAGRGLEVATTVASDHFEGANPMVKPAGEIAHHHYDV